jgi:hypothetical protein
MATEFSTSVKPAKLKRKQSQAKDLPKFAANGRPSKRTPQLEKDLLAAIETGAPYRIACLACGISDDAFTEWRRKDPIFARQVEVASGKTALRLLKKIEKNADENFSAAAWLLERRFPESFSRPEIQLGLTVNNQVTNNTLVISVEQAERLARRNQSIDKQLDEISRTYEARQKLLSGASSEVIREVEAESASSLVPSDACIELPPAAGRTRGWWSQLSSGDGSRSITVEAAEFVLRDLVRTVRGPNASAKLKIDFGSGSPALSEVWSALNETAGPDGWTALVKRGNPQEGPGSSPRRARSR